MCCSWFICLCQKKPAKPVSDRWPKGMLLSDIILELDDRIKALEKRLEPKVNGAEGSD